MRLAVSLLLAAATTSSFAALPAQDTVKGASDHPLLSRFAGSRMVAYAAKEYDQTVMPTGVGGYKNNELVFRSQLTPEGKLTRIVYNYAPDRSSLEVFRNYQAALDKAGLKTVYTCAGKACGDGFASYFLRTRIDKDGFIKGGSQYREPFNWGGNDPRYLVAQGKLQNGAPVHVLVLVVPPENEYNGGIYTEIVEGKPMETGKVTASLTASDMAKSIASEGRVAVYGVYFDTDKTDVKAESKDALGEMAKLLQQDPQLKVHIVGHTDNQGTVAHNMELSQKRAEAVVKTLTAQYKVDAKRLTAKGVGAYAPVASNDTEAGREKNRRVELVKQ